MKKKILSVLLMGAMMCSLYACGSGGEKSTDQNADESTAKVEETQKVVMGFLAFNQPSAEDEEMVEEAINEITRKSIGVEVDLLIMDAASYNQQIPLMLSGGEQLDIYNAIGVGFSSMVNSGYTLDLEENDLIQTYGQGIIDTMGEYIDGCRVGGVMYGLPQNRDLAGPSGYAVVAEYLDTIGFEYNPDEINKITQEELEQMLADLHAAYPDKITMVTQPTARTQILCDYPGGDWFGVLMNPESSLEVTDLYSSEEYLNICKMYYNWNQLGYISADALTDSNASYTQVPSGKGMAYGCGIKPGIIQQESTSNGRQTAMFQIEDEYLLASSSLSNMPWRINSNTEYPEAAMKLLNEFYTNAELSDLLCYGIEGSHYAVNEEGLYTYPEGVTAEDAGYHPNITFLMPNEFIAGVWEGNSADVWTDTKDMNEKAIKSIAIGFTFDNSELTAEYTALNNIYEEYRYQLEYGFLEPESGISEMVERMEKAGLQKYIDAKQEQLNKWAEETGTTSN